MTADDLQATIDSLREGDRVRVTVECRGHVATIEGPVWLSVVPYVGAHPVFNSYTREVEILERAKPVWVDAQVIRAGGMLHRLRLPTDYSWRSWLGADGRYRTNEEIAALGEVEVIVP